MCGSNPLSELWSHEAVQCVLVPDGQSVQVELRNASGAAFLRKCAPTREAALNEAEYMRLLLGGWERTILPKALKPFALVIEEDRFDCDVLIEALKVSGMRALSCRSGAEGVCIAREVIPDLILLDWRMPDVSGADVCRLLRQDALTAAIPIIVVSDNADLLRVDGCLADAVLTKPCPTQTLAAAARLFVRHLTYVADDAW